MATEAEAPPEPEAKTPGQLTEITKQSSRTRIWHNVAVRLADEGVPVRAIMRSLMLSYEEVREALAAATERGMLLSIPRDDWPAGTRRDERQPDTVPLDLEDEHMVMLAMRTFTLSPALAKMLVAFLRRPQMSKTSLHIVTQKDDGSNARPDPSDIKIVDVFVCKLRAKLKVFREKNPTFTAEIETIWGIGYCIPSSGKESVFRALGIKHDTFAIPAKVAA